jgi:hypothetical protein
MILTLSVHPSRFSDLLTLDRTRFDPPILSNRYHDSFGNFRHVIRQPKVPQVEHGTRCDRLRAFAQKNPANLPGF